MHLNEIEANAQDQDRGHWFELVDPVQFKPTGLKLLMAGPDSATQRRARLQMADDLAEAADEDGRINAVAREKVRLNCLASCVLGWNAQEDGHDVPFRQANVIRLLRAAQWVEVQVDGFAADRAPYWGGR